MFYSRTKKRPTENAETGSKEKNIYSIEVNDKGVKNIVVTGKTDHYAKIQESAEGCKIENIVKRFTLGDTTALNKAFGMYIDTTNLPENLAEAQTAMQNLTTIFNALPIDIRKEYNMNASEFIADYGSEKFKKLMTPPDKTEFTRIIPETKIEVKNEQ